MPNHRRSLQALFITVLLSVAGSASAQPASADSGSAGSGPNAAIAAKAAKAADRKLAHRIATALARTRGLDSSRIFVKARDGHVTLSGSVTDGAQVSLAEDAAKHVDGVKAVDNDIRVAGTSL